MKMHSEEQQQDNGMPMSGRRRTKDPYPYTNGGGGKTAKSKKTAKNTQPQYQQQELNVLQQQQQVYQGQNTYNGGGAVDIQQKQGRVGVPGYPYQQQLITSSRSPQRQLGIYPTAEMAAPQSQQYQQSLLKQKKATIRKKQFGPINNDLIALNQAQQYSNTAVNPISAVSRRPSMTYGGQGPSQYQLYQQPIMPPFNFTEPMAGINNYILRDPSSLDEYNSTMSRNQRGGIGSLGMGGSLETALESDLLLMATSNRDNTFDQQTDRRLSNLPGIKKPKNQQPANPIIPQGSGSVITVVKQQYSQQPGGTVNLQQQRPLDHHPRDPRYLTKRNNSLEDDKIGPIHAASGLQSRNNGPRGDLDRQRKQIIHRTQQSEEPPQDSLNLLTSTSPESQNRFGYPPKKHQRMSSQTKHDFGPLGGRTAPGYKLSEPVILDQGKLAQQVNIINTHGYSNSEIDNNEGHQSNQQMNKMIEGGVKRSEYATKRQSRLKPPMQPANNTNNPLGAPEIRRISNQYQTLGQANDESNSRRSSISTNKVGFKNNLVEISSFRNHQDDVTSFRNNNNNKYGISSTLSHHKKEISAFKSPSKPLITQLEGRESSLDAVNDFSSVEELNKNAKMPRMQQPLIKVRKGKGETAAQKQLATLRQLSNEAGQRDCASMGIEVAVIDTLGEEEEYDAINSVSPQGFQQRIIQIQNKKQKQDEVTPIITDQATTFTVKNKRRTEGGGGLSRNNHLIKVLPQQQQPQHQTMGPRTQSDSSIVRDSMVLTLKHCKLQPSLKNQTSDKDAQSVQNQSNMMGFRNSQNNISGINGDKSCNSQGDVRSSTEQTNLYAAGQNESRSPVNEQAKLQNNSVKQAKKRFKLVQHPQQPQRVASNDPPSQMAEEPRTHPHRQKILTIANSGTSLASANQKEQAGANVNRANSTPQTVTSNNISSQITNNNNISSTLTQNYSQISSQIQSSALTQSNCASKIDKILAKIDRTRTDSLLKGGNLGIIFKKNITTTTVNSNKDNNESKIISNNAIGFNNIPGRNTNVGIYNGGASQLTESVTSQDIQVLQQQHQGNKTGSQLQKVQSQQMFKIKKNTAVTGKVSNGEEASYSPPPLQSNEQRHNLGQGIQLNQISQESRISQTHLPPGLRESQQEFQFSGERATTSGVQSSNDDSKIKEIHQKKILKIVGGVQRVQTHCTTEATSGAGTVKKLKIKGSQERSNERFQSVGLSNPISNMTTPGQVQPKFKQIRDARSQDAFGSVQVGSPTPQQLSSIVNNQNQPSVSNFVTQNKKKSQRGNDMLSPNTKITGRGRAKAGQKPLQMVARVASTIQEEEEKQSCISGRQQYRNDEKCDPNEPMVKLMDSLEQPSGSININQVPGKKKSFLQSMQPHELPVNNIAMKMKIGNNTQSHAQNPIVGQGAFSTDYNVQHGAGNQSSDKQSTALSTNHYYNVQGSHQPSVDINNCSIGGGQGYSTGQKANNINYNMNTTIGQFDQSSICITSASGNNLLSSKEIAQAFNTTPENQRTITATGQNYSQPMKIQESSNDAAAFNKKKQSPPIVVSHLTAAQAAGLFSINGSNASATKENPLEQSLKSLQMKISSRYAIEQYQNQIKEESNEENQSSNQDSVSQYRQRNKAKDAKSKQLKQPPHIKVGATTYTSTTKNEDSIDLQLEPLEKDEIIFKEIQTINLNVLKQSRQQPFFPYNIQQTERYVQQENSMISEQMAVQSPRSSHDYRGGIVGESKQLQRSRAHLKLSKMLTEDIQERPTINNNVHAVKQNKLVINFGKEDQKKHEEEEKEEDDEAVEISGHPFYNKGAIQASQELTMVQKKSVDKNKHWLLDSNRFNDVLQNIAQNQDADSDRQHKKEDDQSNNVKKSQKRYFESDESSNGVNSDTVIFEKDNTSSMAGTPPKIAQKIDKNEGKSNNEPNGSRTNMRDASQEEISESSSGIVIRGVKQLNNPVAKTTIAAPPSSKLSPEIKRGKNAAPKMFTFTTDSIEELREASEVAIMKTVMDPLESLVAQNAVPQQKRNAKQTFMTSLHQKLNLDPTEAPVNPQWVMVKHAKMLPLLDHYLRPTYYDVIYLQPASEPSLAKPSVSLDILMQTEPSQPLPMLETNFNFDIIIARNQK